MNEIKYKYRKKLADYFEVTNYSIRKIKELPWLLNINLDWNRLQKVISDKYLFKGIWEASDIDLRIYLNSLYSNTSFSLETAYRKEIYAGPIKPDKDFLWALQYSLRNRNQLNGVRAIHKTLLLFADTTNDSALYFDVYREMANLFRDEGQMDKAKVIYLKLNECFKDSTGKSSNMIVLYELGSLSMDQNEYETAIGYFIEALKIADLTYNLSSKVRYLGAISAAYMELNNLQRAKETLDECEFICKSINDLDLLKLVLQEKSVLLSKMGDYYSAIGILDEKEKICRTLGDNLSLLICLTTKGLVLIRLNLGSEAIMVLEDGLKIAQQFGRKDEIAGILGNLSLAYAKTGDYNQAKIVIKNAFNEIEGKGLKRLEKQLRKIHTEITIYRN